MAGSIHEALSGASDALYETQKVVSYGSVPNPRCLKLFAHILTNDERTVMEIRQSYLQSVSPDRVVVTNKRVIIVRPSFWGLWAGHNIISPTEISLVPYKNIISVVMSRGRILSTIHMRIHGFTDATSAIRNEGVIMGVSIGDAIKLTNYLEEIIEAREERAKDGTAGPEPVAVA
jgi:hypothetical protein